MAELFNTPLTVEKEGYGTLTITPHEYLKKYNEYLSKFVGHDVPPDDIEYLEKVKGIEKMELYPGDDPDTVDLLIYGPINEAGVLDTPLPADIAYGKRSAEEYLKRQEWYQKEE